MKCPSYFSRFKIKFLMLFPWVATLVIIMALTEWQIEYHIAKCNLRVNKYNTREFVRQKKVARFLFIYSVNF